MIKTEKFWDKVAGKFDKRSWKIDPTEIRTLENTRKHLAAGHTVLDYGCATGRMAIELADHVKKIQGIDISSKMIGGAKRKALEHKIENIKFTKATLFDERLETESFDVILALNILHFFEDTSRVLQRTKALLKTGGLIISVTPCLAEKKSFISFLIFLLIFIQTKMKIIPYIRFFKISEFEDIVTDANFQIVETERLSGPAEQYFIVARKR